MIGKIARQSWILVILCIASCKLEPCNDFVCVNGEAQEDFNNCVCICSSGWEGNDCTIEDKCITGNVVCVHGDCVSSTGKCSCFSGYEGDSCQILSRDRFLDNGNPEKWIFRDTCSFTPYYDTLTIRGPSLNIALEILNIRSIDTTFPLSVIVTKMAFEQRTPVNIDNITIGSLKGTLSSDQQTIRVSYLSNSNLCTGTWSRL